MSNRLILALSFVVSCAVACSSPAPQQQPDPAPTPSTPAQPTASATTTRVMPIKVEALPGEASSSEFVLVDAQGAPVALPEPVRLGILSSGLPPLLLHEQRLVVYGGDDALMLFDLRGGREAQPIYKLPSELGQVSYEIEAKWSVGATFAVRERCQSYRAKSGVCSQQGFKVTDRFVVIALAESNGAWEATQTTLDVTAQAPLLRCGSGCSAAEVELLEGPKVRYLVSGGPDDPGAESPDTPKVYEVLSAP